MLRRSSPLVGINFKILRCRATRFRRRMKIRLQVAFALTPCLLKFLPNETAQWDKFQNRRIIVRDISILKETGGYFCRQCGLCDALLALFEEFEAVETPEVRFVKLM